MKALKKGVESFRSTKTQAIAHYKVFLHLVDKYEELNMNTYIEGNLDKVVFSDPKNKETKDQMDHMVENLKNPFDEMYHWCKGEIYDLQALMSAVTIRDNIEKDQKRMEGKKKNTQNDLDNVTTGKKTIRTLLKN